MRSRTTVLPATEWASNVFSRHDDSIFEPGYTAARLRALPRFFGPACAAHTPGTHLAHTHGPFTPPLTPIPDWQADDHTTPGTTSYCYCLDPYDSTNRTCTADCEVLGVGLPEWSLLDPANPATGGVSLTYTGLSEGLSPCPVDPATGRAYLRTITYAIACDAAVPADALEADEVAEGVPCQYSVAARSGAACGCTPDCAGKTCGPDGCGGFCSGPTLYGACPNGETCQGGACCRSDCGQDGRSSKRDCGSDGCGGSCGTCGVGLYCAASHTCMDADAHLPRSAPVEWVQSGGELFGAWLGGALCLWVIVGVAYAQTEAGARILRRAREAGLREALKGGATAAGNERERLRGAYRAGDARRGGGYGATAGAATTAESSSSL